MSFDDEAEDLFERLLPVYRKSVAWQMIVWAKHNLSDSKDMFQFVGELAERVAEDKWE